MARRYSLCLRCNTAAEGTFNSVKMLLTTFPRRWLCQRIDANIAITEHVLKRLGLDRSRLIYYGIPEEAADPRENLHPISFSDGANLCFAYVGRFVSLKGLHLILRAAHNLRAAGYRFRIKFVGDGPLRSELEALSETLGLSDCVHFTGFVLGEEFREAMQDVSTVLMPSVWEETAGLAAIEQMMRGRLVIVSDIGGLGEVVGDAGLRFPVDSLQGLIACMKTVLDKPEIVCTKGGSARQHARRMFSQERMVEEHLELYCELVRLGMPGKRSTVQV